MKYLKIVADLITQFSAQLYTGSNGQKCIDLVESGKPKSFLVRSEKFSNWLIRAFRQSSVSVTRSTRDYIIDEFCALADEGVRKDVYVRVGMAQKAVLIDLNDPSYEAVHISGAQRGFMIAPPKGASFLRNDKQLPLPRPISVARPLFLEMFKKLIPNLSQGHWILVLAFILKALHRDRGSYPILVIGGPQGSGKSTLSKRMKNLVDPSLPSLLSPPRNDDDIIVACLSSYLLVFDNMSGLTHRMADVFCRIATGGGISKRKLFTDDGEAFYLLFRPIIINGIDEPSIRPDFLDRCVTLEVKPFESGERVAETELDEEFNANLPLLLGGLYELLADCLAVLPLVAKTKKDLPRMTDYANMGIALEKILKLKPGYFLDAFNRNRAEQIENAFWGDALCCAIFKRLQRDKTHRIEGSAQELLDELFKRDSANKPRSPWGFSGWLRRIEPLLKAKKIVVEQSQRQSHKRTLVIRSEVPMSLRELSLAEIRAQDLSRKGENYDLDL